MQPRLGVGGLGERKKLHFKMWECKECMSWKCDD